MDKTLAIDFGTTNSVAYYFDDGKLTPIRNLDVQSQYLFPSYVRYKGNEVLTGYAAKLATGRGESTLISCVKRLIGLTYSEYCEFNEEERNIFGCEVVAGDDGLPRFEIKEGLTVSCIEVASILFKKIKIAGDTVKGGQATSDIFHSAYVTVPANFNDRQCSAIKEAARISGLEVLCLITEPTAAALSYCFSGEKVDIKSGENMLVYDFGGGTFDVSYIKCDRPDHFVVEDVDGDPILGGNDIDNALSEFVMDKYKQLNGSALFRNEGRMGKKRRAILHTICEEAKIQLANCKTQELNFQDINPDAESLTISRADLNSVAEEFVKKTIVCIDRLLKRHSLSVGNFKKVFLVGGSSKLECVRELIINKMVRSTFPDVQPMSCVAQGAATMMKRNFENRRGVDEKIVISYGLGCGDNEVAMILSKGACIPASNNVMFATTENYQKEVSTKIYQYRGEVSKDIGTPVRNVRECIFLRELTFQIPHPKSMGKQKLHTAFNLDFGGTLKVTCTDPDTNELMTCQEFKGISGGRE